MNRKLVYISILFLSFWFSYCSKYLDKKPDNRLATLNTLEDMQAFLDNSTVLNNSVPTLLEIGSDNYYVSTLDWSSQFDALRYAYLWKKTDTELLSGSWPYQPIFYANIVLDEISDKKGHQKELWDNVKGSAHFFRGFYFFQIAQLYARQYVSSTAKNTLGIPLRLSSDHSEKSTRSTIEDTYNQITKDLKEAATLLPDLPIQAVKTRPSKAAAYGQLAKVYLSMGKFDSAYNYSNKCLNIYNDLLNLNDITSDYAGVAASAPFKRFNREIIFYARSSQPNILAPARAKIDSNLINQYSNYDLRRQAYFRANTGSNANTFRFKGDYDGSGSSSGFVFAGVTTDEMYLIRAEASARLGNIQDAMNDLNTLIITRWDNTQSYPVLTASTQSESLNIILIERRKELLFRGTRWTDIKRLGTDDPTIQSKRNIDNQIYNLPNDYIFQIPYSVILLSGIPQNQ